MFVDSSSRPLMITWAGWTWADVAYPPNPQGFGKLIEDSSAPFERWSEMVFTCNAQPPDLNPGGRGAPRSTKATEFGKTGHWSSEGQQLKHVFFFGIHNLEASWTCFSIGKRPSFCILLETDGGFSPVCELNFSDEGWQLDSKIKLLTPFSRLLFPFILHETVISSPFFLCVFVRCSVYSCVTTQVPNSSGGLVSPPPKKNRENQTTNQPTFYLPPIKHPRDSCGFMVVEFIMARQEMADQEKQSLLEALEVKRQQREQESQAQERMLQQLKAGKKAITLFRDERFSIRQWKSTKEGKLGKLPYSDHVWIFVWYTV